MGRSRRIYELLLHVWPLVKVAFHLGKQPVIGPLFRPLMDERSNQVTVLPVNESIPVGQNSPLPVKLLLSLAQQASERFIMSDCLCRSREGCQEHSRDLGCLFLGEGAAQIHPSLGRLASLDEVRAHIERASAEGLLPMIVHTRFDALTLGIPYRRMLTICFCCECCCIVHRGLRTGPSSFWKAVQPLPGLSVSVGDECTQCGLCAPSCPVRAISMDHDRAIISEACIGCGCCASECPTGAIRLQVDDEQAALQGLLGRVQKYGDIRRVLA
jgi:UDP-glucose 4-epimerase